MDAVDAVDVESVFFASREELDVAEVDSSVLLLVSPRT